MVRGQIRAMARSARGRAAWAAPLIAAACAPQVAAPPAPLPLPAMGAKVPVQLDKATYTVIRSEGPAGHALKVFRADPPAFDFSQGLEAKRVAEAYCAGLNRALAPEALGMFEAAGSDWVFEGGCT